MNYAGLQDNWLIDSWRVSIAYGPHVILSEAKDPVNFQ